jgi:hypothetical protein
MLLLPVRHFVPGAFLANLSFEIGAAEAVALLPTPVFPLLSADLAGPDVGVDRAGVEMVDGLAWFSALGLAS